MQKFTFHCVGLPHTKVTKEYLPCAYTMKVLNFCKMMKSLGHTVYLYAGEGSDADLADEVISVISDKQQQEFFGHTDWRKHFFPIDWDANIPYWKLFNENTVKEMQKRIQPTDFICVIGGNCQQPITASFQKNLAVEFGVGYKGIYTNHRVFESYAWMHHVYGLTGIENGGYFDIVIPNYFDIDDFPYSEERDDNFLFVGRMIARKGVHVAAEVCGMTNSKLILAGQGAEILENGNIKAKEFELPAREGLEYLGTIGKEKRGELMSRAKALFVPTQYIGPFEGVHIEAMLCGTPVITTDWGVFSESISQGFNGFRCRTISEMIEAMKEVEKFTPEHRMKIREWAQKNFGLDRIKWQYQYYFEQLYTLWGKGWYAEKDSRDALLNRYNKF